MCRQNVDPNLAVPVVALIFPRRLEVDLADRGRHSAAWCCDHDHGSEQILGHAFHEILRVVLGRQADVARVAVLVADLVVVDGLEEREIVFGRDGPVEEAFAAEYIGHFSGLMEACRLC